MHNKLLILVYILHFLCFLIDKKKFVMYVLFDVFYDFVLILRPLASYFSSVCCFWGMAEVGGLF